MELPNPDTAQPEPAFLRSRPDTLLETSRASSTRPLRRPSFFASKGPTTRARVGMPSGAHELALEGGLLRGGCEVAGGPVTNFPLAKGTTAPFFSCRNFPRLGIVYGSDRSFLIPVRTERRSRSRSTSAIKFSHRSNALRFRPLWRHFSRIRAEEPLPHPPPPNRSQDAKAPAVPPRLVLDVRAAITARAPASRPHA